MLNVPGSGCEIISEGMRLHMNIQTHSPTSLPVLSTSPIDYYDGGTVRQNTDFYSWDTSFGLVNPRPRYSCLQVVFCVNLGTFFKCFLQLGWRLMGVRSTLPERSLNAPFGHAWFQTVFFILGEERQGVRPRLLLLNPLCCHLDN